MNYEVEAQTTELDTQDLDAVTGGNMPTAVESPTSSRTTSSSTALLPAVQKGIISI